MGSRCHGIRQAAFGADAFFRSSGLPTQVLLELDVSWASSRGHAALLASRNQRLGLVPSPLGRRRTYAEFLAHRSGKAAPPEWRRWLIDGRLWGPTLAQDMIDRHLRERGRFWTDLQSDCRRPGRRTRTNTSARTRRERRSSHPRRRVWPRWSPESPCTSALA